MKAILTAISVMALMTCPAYSQVIQQPVVGVNSVQTVVSVPDRRSALLGGVSRARSSSNQFGFSPFGSAKGGGAANLTQRVFVTIHDFETVDRQLLSTRRVQKETKPTFRNRHARNAWNQISKE